MAHDDIWDAVRGEGMQEVVIPPQDLFIRHSSPSPPCFSAVIFPLIIPYMLRYTALPRPAPRVQYTRYTVHGSASRCLVYQHTRCMLHDLGRLLGFQLWGRGCHHWFPMTRLAAPPWVEGRWP